MRLESLYGLIARIIIIGFSVAVIASMAKAQNSFRDRGLVRQDQQRSLGIVSYLDQYRGSDLSMMIIVDKAENSYGSNDQRRHFDDRETEQIMDVIVFANGYQVHRTRHLVSTGSEKTVCPKTKECHKATTPVGFFKINGERRYPKYKSKTWDAWMANAQFFFQGWAIHGIYSEKHHLSLGTRASGGCIRMSHTGSEELFELVSIIGPQNVGLYIYDSSVDSSNEDKAQNDAYRWLDANQLDYRVLDYRK